MNSYYCIDPKIDINIVIYARLILDRFTSDNPQFREIYVTEVDWGYRPQKLRHIHYQQECDSIVCSHVDQIKTVIVRHGWPTFGKLRITWMTPLSKIKLALTVNSIELAKAGLQRKLARGKETFKWGKRLETNNTFWVYIWLAGAPRHAYGRKGLNNFSWILLI